MERANSKNRHKISVPPNTVKKKIFLKNDGKEESQLDATITVY
jgi:hypothetical protein